MNNHKNGWWRDVREAMLVMKYLTGKEDVGCVVVRVKVVGTRVNGLSRIVIFSA
jgi:hypothetical protein